MRRTRERERRVDTAVAERQPDGFAVSAGSPPAALRQPGAPAALPGVSASAPATRRAVASHAAMPAAAAAHMASLSGRGLRDVVSDADALRNAGPAVDAVDGIEPRTPQNLPAIIQTAIAVSGDNSVTPQWHMVRHLPGYLREPIRAMGRQVFAQFTETAVEDIQTVTTLSNREEEVKALMGWISRNGIRDDRAEMDFEQTMPGYKADVQVWSAEEYTFLLVRDFAGHYVYGWPGGRGVHLDYEPPAMLR